MIVIVVVRHSLLDLVALAVDGECCGCLSRLLYVLSFVVIVLVIGCCCVLAFVVVVCYCGL